MLGQKHVPSREGGVEVVVEELAVRMVQRGHAVTCLNRGGHHVSGTEFDGPELSVYKGIILKKLFTINRKGLAAMTASFFGAVRAAFGAYDIIHFHAEGSCFFLWLPKLFGKRCVVTVHGLDWQREKWKNGFGSKVIRCCEREAVRHADEIIVLSHHMKDYFSKTYGRETSMIPNGVTAAKIAQEGEITEKFGLRKGEYILSLGRIVPEKGLRCLVKAFRELKTEKRLVIAGGVSDSEDFAKELAEMASGDDRILFTGFVSGRILEELYSNAYLYVMPSDLEGMPLSLMEAMSYGNCCVVSDIPECLEVVEDYAVVFERGNVQDLRAKLQRLCDDPSLPEMFRGFSSKFICGKYNWDTVTEETLNLYQCACRRKFRRSGKTAGRKSDDECS